LTRIPGENALKKTPTGIHGLDEITFGGLPKGRPSLVTGAAGSGKTMLAMEFLVRGATEFNEPGVFIAFEETSKDLAENFASRGYDLAKLEAENKLVIDYVYIERSEIEETGEYDLEGLFIRLGSAIEAIGAKRVVLDTIEALFSGLSNTAILRAELRRLFRFLKDKGVTAIVTGERGHDTLTRYGLEEYVADCVILLDHRMQEQIATRRLRILKYRGSAHATNEFPFIIADDGFSVLPVTTLGLAHEASQERVSTGITELDEMMGGDGYYRATSIFVTGTAGTGKTSIAASFVAAACQRGEKCIYFAFEESPSQLIRNMNSIGVDLGPWRDKGQLVFHAIRPTQYGLETHLASMISLIRATNPSIIVLDPISNLISAGDALEARMMLTRLIDYLKNHNVTALFTSLTGGELHSEARELGISSLMDTWIAVRNLEHEGERNRGLHVLKSRGMAHTNRIREFLLTDQGIRLIQAYIGPEGLVTGTARELQQVRDQEAALALEQDHENALRALEQKRKLLEAKIAAMQAEFAAEELETKRVIAQTNARQADMKSSRSGTAKGKSS
jgi:circadian clock protein KaiC